MKYYGEVMDRLQLCSDMVFVSFSTIVTCCVVVVLVCYAKASTELMSETLDFLPPDVTDPIKMQADMMNIPTIGSDKNYVWHSMQVNISPVKAFGEGMYTVMFMIACLIIIVQRNIWLKLLGYLVGLTSIIMMLPQATQLWYRIATYQKTMSLVDFTSWKAVYMLFCTPL